MGPNGEALWAAIQQRIADTQVQCVWCGEMGTKASCEKCRAKLARNNGCVKCGQPADGYTWCWVCTKASVTSESGEGVLPFLEKREVTSESDIQMDMR